MKSFHDLINPLADSQELSREFGGVYDDSVQQWRGVEESITGWSYITSTGVSTGAPVRTGALGWDWNPNYDFTYNDSITD